MSDLFEDKNIPPMLLKEEKEPFDSDEYIFELKLDGIRCIAYLSPEAVVLQNKRYKDVSELYPELKQASKCVKSKCVLDGELVVIKDGKPDFYALQARSLMTDPFRIALQAKSSPVQFVAYDMLYFNGEDLTDLPLTERKKTLTENVIEGNNLALSRWTEKHGKALFELTKQQGLEGIVAKRKDGKYRIGKRASEWIKIKVMQEEDLCVLGYVPDKNGNVKDLILGVYENGVATKRGNVYLGVSKQEREYIKNFAKKHSVSVPYFAEYKNAVWLSPNLVGTVIYMQETANGSLRQPVWKGLKE